MNVLFASAAGLVPFGRGGAEHGAHALLLWLSRRGHTVRAVGSLDNYVFTFGGSLATVPEVLARSGIRFRWWAREGMFRSPDGERAAVTIDQRVSYDAGYSITLVERDRFVADACTEAIERDPPDVVVTQLSRSNEIAAVAARAAVPVVLIQPSFEPASTHSDSFDALHRFGRAFAAIVVPSEFVRDGVAALFGFSAAVIPPIIDDAAFDCDDSAENIGARGYTTLVNPQPKKGLDILLALAARFPERRFLTVETWFRSCWEIEAIIGGFPNIDIVPMQETHEAMAAVYRQTRVLLVPSNCDEAFGRVVPEAQFGGVPVLASRRGGLPETVGDGGMLVRPDAPPAAWIEALLALDDPALFRRLSAQARMHAEQFRIRATAPMFEHLLRQIAGERAFAGCLANNR